MKWKDAKNIINYILAKDFGKIFIEIIILGIHVWAISLKHPISIYLKIILSLIFLIILVDLFRTANTARKVFQEKHVPIVVAVGRSDNETRGGDEVSAMVSDVLDSMSEYHFDERTFEDDFHIAQDNWLMERKSSLTKDSGEWVNLVHRFRDKSVRLSANPELRGKKVFHLFLMCPSALAIGLGAVTGIYQETVLHHFQRGTGAAYPYLPLINFHSRGDLSRGGLHDIKSKATKPYEYICVEAPGTFTRILPVSLHLSGYDPKNKVDKLASGRSLSTVHIRNTYNNTLSVDADWFRVAQEVVSVLRDLLSYPDVEKIEFYQSCPIIIAFAVGMALGTHARIEVFQWDGEKYYPVFPLNTLRKTR